MSITADGLSRAAESITPPSWRLRMRRKAELAGLGPTGVEKVMRAKATVTLAAAAVLGAFAFLFGAGIAGLVLWIVAGAAIGYLLPDVWLAGKAEQRQAEIRRDLPETLDLLSIAVAAGLGLEAAIDLVAQRLPGPLGEELARLLQETALGSSRRQALQRLRERTEVAELSAFALALSQADSLGSPVAEVLRSQASEVRMLRRQRAREAAAKVPIKLLFPLLIAIFPALGIVVVGPAAISIARAFGIG